MCVLHLRLCSTYSYLLGYNYPPKVTEVTSQRANWNSSPKGPYPLGDIGVIVRKMGHRRPIFTGDSIGDPPVGMAYLLGN